MSEIGVGGGNVTANGFKVSLGLPAEHLPDGRELDDEEEDGDGDDQVAGAPDTAPGQFHLGFR